MESKRQLRLGLIHIPKTAGSSLNDSLGKVLCPDQVHIRALNKHAEVENDPRIGKRRLRVEYGSDLHLKIKEMAWVSGHISALAMEEFSRDFVFSVFRDRKMRVLSQYRFGRWRWDKANNQGTKIVGAISPSISFADWLEKVTNDSRDPTRFGHNLIVGDRFKGTNDFEKATRDSLVSIDDMILERLKRVDRIYFPAELEEVLINLSDEGLAPSVKVQKKSRVTEITTYKQSKPERVLKLLHSYSNSLNVESKIFNFAKTIHATYWTGREVSDSEFLSACEKYRII